MKKWVAVGLSGVLLVGFLIFVISSLWIGSDVRRYCKTAKKIYRGDCVEVLSEMVDDLSMPFRERNHAIWALGQLGDPRGLMYLTKYFTGKTTEVENKDLVLSQKEIVKAIGLMQGKFNPSALIWRYNIE